MNKDISIGELRSIAEEGAVERLFKMYYTPLCRTVFRVIKDQDASEDIVQDVFVKMWHKRMELEINTSIKSYLFRAAVNAALNYIGKARKLEQLEDEEPMYFGNDAGEQLDFEETERNINQAIDGLPPACKTIFVMSRYEEMSYKEIAESLQISIKTVENQMGKALKILREKLRVYLLELLIVSIFYYL